MKRLCVVTLLFWSPAYCCETRYPLKREDAKANLLAAIEDLKKELDKAKAEVTAEDGQHKRTDVKKIMGDQADQAMDMVQTCVTVDGSPVEMHCDAPNCHEVAHNLWFSVDTGILFKRCDKHKDGVIVK